MKKGIIGRATRSVLSLALAVPLAVATVGAAPVAAAPSPAFVLCVAVSPNVWVIPLVGNGTFLFGLGQSTQTFRVYIKNNRTCSLPWSFYSVVTSKDGHIWGYVPTGPTAGYVPGNSTISTSVLVTKPVGGTTADLYVRVFTGSNVNPGFHWSLIGYTVE